MLIETDFIKSQQIKFVFTTAYYLVQTFIKLLSISTQTSVEN